MRRRKTLSITDLQGTRWRTLLEPDVATAVGSDERDQLSINEAANLSIAISLRRIANSLQRSTKPNR
jgi:hypothetical protein